MTGAACARLVVKTAAAVAGVSETMSARSSGGSDRPVWRLMPTLTPAALKPSALVTPLLMVPMVIRRSVQRWRCATAGCRWAGASGPARNRARDRCRAGSRVPPSDSTAPSAASRPDSPSSISSAVITSGGSSRTTVSAVRLTTTPRDNAADTTGRRLARQLEPPDQAGAPHLLDDGMSGGDRVEPLLPCDVRLARCARAIRRRPVRPGRTAPRGTRAGCRRRCCRDRRTRSFPRPAR